MINPIERSGPAKILTASCFIFGVCTFFWGGSALNNHIDLNVEVLDFLQSKLYFIKPLTGLSTNETDFTRLTTLLTFKTLNHLLFSAIFCGLGIALTFLYLNPPRKPRQIALTEFLFTPLEKSRVKVKLGKGNKNSEKWVVNPFPDFSIKLTMPVIRKKEMPRKGTVAALEKRLISLLTYYRNVPASIDGYHGSTNLYHHSLGVAKKMKQEAVTQKIDEPLIGVVALAHDLEKVMGYTLTADMKWTRKNNFYHQYGPLTLKSLPEFKALPKVDRDCISRVLAYRHSNKRLPSNLSTRQRALIKLLWSADRQSTRQEQTAAPSTQHADNQQLQDLILRAIPELHFNTPAGAGHSDGWFRMSDNYGITTLENIRKILFASADSQTIQQFQIGVPVKRNGEHPLAIPVINVLREKGLLMETIGQYASENGFFRGTIKLANPIALHHIILLNRFGVENSYPDLISNWGSATFKFTIAANQ